MEICNEVENKFIQAFQHALIWQDGELDHMNVENLADQTVSDIIALTDNFVSILDKSQVEELNKDPDNFGHWLCLEQMGHGSGFFDSPNQIVSSISELLNQNELQRPGDLYLTDGIIYSDFFKYGSD